MPQVKQNGNHWKIKQPTFHSIFVMARGLMIIFRLREGTDIFLQQSSHLGEIPHPHMKIFETVKQERQGPTCLECSADSYVLSYYCSIQGAHKWSKLTLGPGLGPSFKCGSMSKKKTGMHKSPLDLLRSGAAKDSFFLVAELGGKKTYIIKTDG